jgi:hypothetical protein
VIAVEPAKATPIKVATAKIAAVSVRMAGAGMSVVLMRLDLVRRRARHHPFPVWT